MEKIENFQLLQQIRIEVTLLLYLRSWLESIKSGNGSFFFLTTQLPDQDECSHIQTHLGATLKTNLVSYYTHFGVCNRPWFYPKFDFAFICFIFTTCILMDGTFLYTWFIPFCLLFELLQSVHIERVLSGYTFAHMVLTQVPDFRSNTFLINHMK
jgi:hypothetical protein